MENSGESIQLSMTFEMLGESSQAKVVFLLQPDNPESYDLVADFKSYMDLLGDNIRFKIHYKIFRNMALDDLGLSTQADPSTMPQVVFIDDDYYFVVKNNSFEKSRSLFFESLKQMCLYFASEPTYTNYMKTVHKKCFLKRDASGNLIPVSHFMQCTHDIYGATIKGNDPKFDEVRLTRK